MFKKTLSISFLLFLASLCLASITAKAADVEPPEWIFAEEGMEDEVARWVKCTPLSRQKNGDLKVEASFLL